MENLWDDDEQFVEENHDRIATIKKEAIRRLMEV